MFVLVLLTQAAALFVFPSCFLDTNGVPDMFLLARIGRVADAIKNNLEPTVATFIASLTLIACEE